MTGVVLWKQAKRWQRLALVRHDPSSEFHPPPLFYPSAVACQSNKRRAGGEGSPATSPDFQVVVLVDRDGRKRDAYQHQEAHVVPLLQSVGWREKPRRENKQQQK